MVFLTVGTQSFQFNRLLEAVDRLIGERVIQEAVIAQIGHSTYIPHNYRAYPFIDKEEFTQMVRNCDLMITHGGVGTIMEGIAAGKKIIVVPRKKIYQEHVDDHQQEIADKFEIIGNICICREIADLEKCYDYMISTTQYSPQIQLHFSNTANFLNKYLEGLTGHKK